MQSIRHGVDLGQSAFLPPGQASKVLGVPRATLLGWAKDGVIDYIRKGGRGTRHYYDVNGFLKRNATTAAAPTPQKARIVYARVSTRAQLDDLERQKKYLVSKYPGYDVVCDVGSGINWKRPGLRSILDRCLQGSVDEVVVAHADRLTRLGFELVRYIIEDRGGAKLVVLNNKKASPTEDMVAELLSIITVYSARANGLRKYRDKIKEDYAIPDETTEEPVHQAVRAEQVVL